MAVATAPEVATIALAISMAIFSMPSVKFLFERVWNLIRVS